MSTETEPENKCANCGYFMPSCLMEEEHGEWWCVEVKACEERKSGARK